MNRKEFLYKASTLAGVFVVASSRSTAEQQVGALVSVLGHVKPDTLGITLMHEHIIADFVGTAKGAVRKYDPDEVFKKALPRLVELKQAGCNSFVDCTPVYFGRNVQLLQRLAKASGLNILTNTGYYGAFKENFLPPHVYTETASQLADRWIREHKQGIEGTGVHPGFIKTSVDEGPLRPVYKKLLEAVAITHLQTGLSISAHTGDGVAALGELEVLQKSGVHGSAFRWVHAQNEKDKNIYLKAAGLGAWLEFDGINDLEPASIDHHVACVKFMKQNGLLNQTLISQDAGWYWVGEPDGGKFRRYTAIFDTFIPALKEAGISESEINQLLVNNPRESLMIKVRRF